jgi:hypothetical protein
MRRLAVKGAPGIRRRTIGYRNMATPGPGHRKTKTTMMITMLTMITMTTAID